ncbi:MULTISPECIES: TonB-dependent receptor [Tenacibaculum]|uniref:TonB-dependent receptor n=1 Tax=Tenacibaculum TaxID=104267 RepID=UPI001F0A301F|nr:MULTISPECIES: TonB-dependent receptor [Tenacibaculum]MCH3881926.1 TonB-dependent receptor [Tenacibaculum aquimarinum]MDO6598504.1 TonB-dependent receptor [Tenacibaculum sp. 1_MG-2023]
MKKYIIGICMLIPFLSFSQQELRGMIMDKTNPKDNLGVFGANVYWLNTTVGATTDEKGWFKIPYKSSYKKLVVSFIGYKTDTINITSLKPIHHFITDQSTLDEVSVSVKKKATQKSFLQTANVFTVNSEELLKAACCNLAESFETNPSIDVNFSDALTGTKQIQMLGLKSPYLLISQENIPSIRGAAQVFGLTFTPGTWVESIQITKGAGSVINGFESISGQINAELVKPYTDNKFFLNAYGSLGGRLELNTHFNQKVSDKWQTGLYIHGDYRGEKFDRNNDNFLDNPLAEQINIMNRWQYTDAEKGWVSFINFRYMNDEKQTGEIDFNPITDKGTTNAWGSEIKTKRFDTSLKLGYVFPELPFQSFGFQLAYSNHNQDSYFGLNRYDIKHQSIYSNLLFNSIIGDTRNKFSVGINFAYDVYDELVNITDYSRKENSFGGFFEYAFDNLDDFSFTAGLRLDTHNLLGTFVTPRFHMRYAPWEKGVLRASIGQGRKAANIFAENQQLFASSRKIDVQSTGGKIYGLDPEVAWNYGVSYLQGFNLFDKKGDITFDFYRTDFQNQVVVDWENPQEIAFYNLEGKSYANSFQTEINYNIIKYFNMRLAYKYYDIETDYQSGKAIKPLTPNHRFFANVSYETIKDEEIKKYWKFDVTYNLIGEQRLPNTSTNPVQYQLSEYSDSYSLLNAQVTKVFSDKFEVYVGGENLTNYKQKNPILANDDPFGANFDTTIVYAPIFGQMFYGGLRFKLN